MTTIWDHKALSTRRPISEKLRLLVEVLAVYTRSRWLLMRMSLPQAAVALRAGAAGETRVPETLSEQLSAARLGLVVARVLEPLPFDSRCLMRSLVLTTMLARRGIESSIVIGVRSDPEFSAHAWVESNGVALLPPGDFGRVVEV